MTLTDLIAREREKLAVLEAAQTEIAVLRAKVASLEASVLTPVEPDLANRLFFATFVNSVTAGTTFRLAAVDPSRAQLVGPGRDGQWAARLTVLPGDGPVELSGIAKRAELSLTRDQTDGDEGVERWYAHSLLLPEEFTLPVEWGAVVAQFHWLPLPGVTGGGQPNFLISIKPDGTMRLIGVGGAPWNGAPGHPGVFGANLGPIVRRAWYDFVHHVRWAKDGSGMFDTWLNGSKVLEHRGATMYDVSAGNYFKTGIYGVFPQMSAVWVDRWVKGTTWRSVALGNLVMGQFAVSVDNSAFFSESTKAAISSMLQT